MGYGEGSLIPYSIRIGAANIRTFVISAQRNLQGLRADLNFRVRIQVDTTYASSVDRSYSFKDAATALRYGGTGC